MLTEVLAWLFKLWLAGLYAEIIMFMVLTHLNRYDKRMVKTFRGIAEDLDEFRFGKTAAALVITFIVFSMAAAWPYLMIGRFKKAFNQ